MSRDEATRRQVLNLDRYRCQICGISENIQVHHVVPLGMGGSQERDVPENMITLCATCHEKLHAAKFFIEKWDRANHILEISDETHHIITHNPKALKKLFGTDKLWFYRKNDAEKGIEITNRLSAYSLIDRDVAKDAYELSQIYKTVDPEARSFKDYLASRGINPDLSSIAKLYKKSLELNFPWQEGWTATDYRRQLKDAGMIKPRKSYWLIYRPLQVVNAGPEGMIVGVWHGTADQVADTIDISRNEVAVKIGRAFGLTIENGQAITREGKSMAIRNLDIDSILKRSPASTVKEGTDGV